MTLEQRTASPGVRIVLLCLVGFAFALLAWWPMMATYPHTPELDGQYSYYQFEIGRAIITQYHELPLWNPYDCRGIPHWDFPESMGASPILLTTFWLKPLYQYYLWNLIHCTAGFVGMWLLVRDDLKLSRIATLCAALAWALGAAHVAQYSTGHEMFVGFWNLPLLLFLWRSSEKHVARGIGVGFVLAWMIYDGGTYPVPFCVLFLVLEAGTRLTSLARLKSILIAGIITGVVCFLLAAPRLLPMAMQFTAHVRPNPYPDVDAMQSLENVRAMFTMRESLWSLRLPGQQYVWNEYISYLGFGGVLLALIGMMLSTRKRPELVFLTIITLVLMLGHFAKWAPWSLLQKNVFPFTSMRVPSRMRFCITLLAAIFTGCAIDGLPLLVRNLIGPARAKAVRAVLIGIALVGTGDAMAFGYQMLSTRFGWAPATPVERSPRFYYGGSGLTPVFTDQPRQNRAWLGCRANSWAFYENAPVWVGDVPQARPAGTGVTITNVTRTANRFTFNVKVDEPTARVTLNSAYGAGWRSTVGTVVQHGDMLAVDLPQGEHRVEMRYWPQYLTLGISLAFIGVLGIALYLQREKVRELLGKRGAKAKAKE